MTYNTDAYTGENCHSMAKVHPQKRCGFVERLKTWILDNYYNKTQIKEIVKNREYILETETPESLEIIRDDAAERTIINAIGSAAGGWDTIEEYSNSITENGVNDYTLNSLIDTDRTVFSTQVRLPKTVYTGTGAVTVNTDNDTISVNVDNTTVGINSAGQLYSTFETGDFANIDLSNITAAGENVIDSVALNTINNNATNPVTQTNKLLTQASLANLADIDFSNITPDAHEVIYEDVLFEIDENAVSPVTETNKLVTQAEIATFWTPQPTNITSTDPRTVVTGSGTYNVTIDTTGITAPEITDPISSFTATPSDDGDIDLTIQSLDNDHETIIYLNSDELTYESSALSLKIDPSEDNKLSTTVNGLYVPPTNPADLISEDSNNDIILGSDNKLYAPPALIPVDLISEDEGNDIILGSDNKLYAHPEQSNVSVANYHIYLKHQSSDPTVSGSDYVVDSISIIALWDQSDKFAGASYIDNWLSQYRVQGEYNAELDVTVFNDVPLTDYSADSLAHFVWKIFNTFDDADDYNTVYTGTDIGKFSLVGEDDLEYINSQLQILQDEYTFLNSEVTANSEAITYLGDDNENIHVELDNIESEIASLTTATANNTTAINIIKTDNVAIHSELDFIEVTLDNLEEVTAEIVKDISALEDDNSDIHDELDALEEKENNLEVEIGAINVAIDGTLWEIEQEVIDDSVIDIGYSKTANSADLTDALTFEVTASSDTVTSGISAYRHGAPYIATEDANVITKLYLDSALANINPNPWGNNDTKITSFTATDVSDTSPYKSLNIVQSDGFTTSNYSANILPFKERTWGLWTEYYVRNGVTPNYSEISAASNSTAQKILTTTQNSAGDLLLITQSSDNDEGNSYQISMTPGGLTTGARTKLYIDDDITQLLGPYTWQVQYRINATDTGLTATSGATDAFMATADADIITKARLDTELTKLHDTKITAFTATDVSNTSPYKNLKITQSDGVTSTDFSANIIPFKERTWDSWHEYYVRNGGIVDYSETSLEAKDSLDETTYNASQHISSVFTTSSDIYNVDAKCDLLSILNKIDQTPSAQFRVTLSESNTSATYSTSEFWLGSQLSPKSSLPSNPRSWATITAGIPGKNSNISLDTDLAETYISQGAGNQTLSLSLRNGSNWGISATESSAGGASFAYIATNDANIITKLYLDSLTTVLIPAMYKLITGTELGEWALNEMLEFLDSELKSQINSLNPTDTTDTTDTIDTIEEV